MPDGSVYGNNLNTENSQFVNLLPSTTINCTATTMTDWIDLGNISVPSWATKVRVKLELCAIYQNSAAQTSTARITINGVTGNSRVLFNTHINTNDRRDFSWTDEITPGATGSVRLKVQGMFSGSGLTLTADNNGSYVSAVCEFLP